MEELYRKYQGKTIKDDYGKNSKEFIDFANDMKKSMKINAAKYGLRLITFETGHYDMCGYFNLHFFAKNVVNEKKTTIP